MWQMVRLSGVEECPLARQRVPGLMRKQTNKQTQAVAEGRCVRHTGGRAGGLVTVSARIGLPSGPVWWLPLPRGFRRVG